MNLHSSHTRTKWDLNTDHIKFVLQSCNVILLLSYFVDSGDSSEETSDDSGEYIRHIWSKLGLFSILYSSLKGLSSAGTLACVASVSILFRSKERPRNGILGFLATREMTSPLTRAIFRGVFDSCFSIVFCSETARKRLLRRLRVLFGYNDRGSQLYHFLKPSSVPSSN